MLYGYNKKRYFSILEGIDMNDSYTWINRRKMRPAYSATGGRSWTSERIVRPDAARGRTVRGVKRVRRPYTDEHGVRRYTTGRVVITDAARQARAHGHGESAVQLELSVPTPYERVKEMIPTKKVLVPVMAGIAVAGGLAGAIYALRKKKQNKNKHK